MAFFEPEWRWRLQKAAASPVGQDVQKLTGSNESFEEGITVFANKIFRGGKSVAETAVETIAYLLTSQASPIRCKLLAVEVRQSLYLRECPAASGETLLGGCHTYGKTMSVDWPPRVSETTRIWPTSRRGETHETDN